MKKLLAFLLLAASVAQGQGSIKVNGGGVPVKDSATAYTTRYQTRAQIDSALNANSFVLRNSKAAGDSGLVAAGSNGFIAPKTSYTGKVKMLHSAGDTARSITIVDVADSAATVTALAGKAATSHTHDSSNVTGLHTENYYNTKYAAIGSVSGGSSGTISYDTTQTFYFDTTSGRLVINRAGYKRRFKAFDSTSTSLTLSTPGSFTATPSGATQINLAWADVANETNYFIERSPNGSSSWATVGSPAANATSFNNTGLTASTAYYYRLSAIGNGTTYLTSGYATANATTTSNPNLYTYSEDFTQTYWTKQTTLTGSQTDPNGNTLAYKQVERVSSDVCGIYPSFAPVGGTTYSVSIYAKASGTNWTYIKVWDGVQDKIAWFNVSTGAAGSTSGTGITTAINAAGNGFYRISMTVTQGNNGGDIFYGLAPSDGVRTYSGNASNGVIWFGAQINTGSLVAYSAKP